MVERHYNTCPKTTATCENEKQRSLSVSMFIRRMSMKVV
jgi:hypothetical protein